MAHFAQLDENNIVIRTVVISNDDILDDQGNESEQLGVAECRRHFGQTSTWIQCSYNANFRKCFPQPGYTYDSQADVFYDNVKPAHHPSWVLDENFDWVAPIPYPTDGLDYSWDEETLSWVLTTT